MGDIEAQNAEGSKGVPPSVAKVPLKFKIVGRVVMAMRRFQASLNPTYEYGKRTSDSGPVEVVDSNRVTVQPKQINHDSRTSSGRTTSGRTLSGRTHSGRPNSAGQHHGYKGHLLFRPLANPDTAAVKSS